MNADTVRELLSNATPGPWAYKAGTMKHYAHSTDPGEDFGVSLQEMHWQDGREVPAEGNARLIAAAPAVAQWGLGQAQEVARLREALAGVLSLYPADMRGGAHEAHLAGFRPEVVRLVESARALLNSGKL